MRLCGGTTTLLHITHLRQHPADEDNLSIALSDEAQPNTIVSSLTERADHYVSVFRTALIGFVVGVLLTLGSVFSVQYSNPCLIFGSSVSKEEETERAATLYKSILGSLDDSYVDQVDINQLFELSVRGMLQSLDDPYTEYISSRDMLNRRDLVGIGAFVMEGGKPDLTQIDGRQRSDVSTLSSPSISNIISGLRVGDRLLAVDGKPITNDQKLGDVRDLLVGKPGSKVLVSFHRPGVDGTQTIEIERKPVKFPDVRYSGMLDCEGGCIGYIQLAQFGMDVGDSMKKSIQSLQEESYRKTGSLDLTVSSLLV
jgi:C-terminal processing protease CtpA/Prc